MTAIRVSPPRFLDLLKEVYEDEAKIPRSGEFRHNPSSASVKKADGSVVGACLRQLYYKATNEPISDPKDFTNVLQADFGNGIHDRVVAKLQKSKKLRLIPEAAGQVTVDELTQVVSFRLDGLVTFRGELGCLEIKTQQSFGLQRMIRSGGPKESDVLQVLSYFGTNPDLRWAALVYFGRDNALRAEYHIYKDENGQFMIRGILPERAERPIAEGLTFEGIVARWKELEAAVRENHVPARDYKVVLTKEGRVTDKRTKNGVDYKSDFRCMYCPYMTTCWSGPNAVEAAYKVGN